MATRRITVKIGGKEYPMTINQNDEEKYRRAAKEINKLIAAYKASYVAGFMIEDLESGKVRQFHWSDVEGLPRDGSHSGGRRESNPRDGSFVEQPAGGVGCPEPRNRQLLE